ncbi:hypothetical protein EVAR_94781_1 [Eumeta japonica]|uniref:Uncharacterized protein n=1 Tax=Eumeta variegata TaxID=151549 RepID=A0A4C1UIQ7_EUMVA|nr:hypothetical protein EVAR_94781_1 [Eumeta japonica]
MPEAVISRKDQRVKFVREVERIFPSAFTRSACWAAWGGVGRRARRPAQCARDCLRDDMAPLWLVLALLPALDYSVTDVSAHLGAPGADAPGAAVPRVAQERALSMRRARPRPCGDRPR